MNDATEHHAEEEEKTYEKATIVYEREISCFHSAITSLFFAMSQTMPTSKMAETFGVSRNWLALVFNTYKHNLDSMPEIRELNRPYENCPYLFPEQPKQLHWKLDTLVVAAKKLEMTVSDIIQAAEDVEGGLPPWFQYRISKASSPHYKLMCIVFEALGYHEYGVLNPLEGKPIEGKRKNRSLSPLFHIEDKQAINAIADRLIENCKNTGFIDAYNNQVISSQDVYKILKRAFHFFIEVDKDPPLSFFLETAPGDLVDRIRKEFYILLDHKHLDFPLRYEDSR